jgi:murein DD-endopeptidase MepM/ murein hydrolase activator NlpD
MKWVKFVKKEFSKGFTFVIVPGSSGTVRSCSIPFSATVLVLGIIIFNIYIFFGFTTQIWRIHQFRKEISLKNSRIYYLEREQREVKPALRKSFQSVNELSQLKIERVRLLGTWRAVQQKGSRITSQVSRAFVRTPPYIMKSLPEDGSVKTSLSELDHNLMQLNSFMKEESEAQQQLLSELTAYEQKLDHTPSIWPVSTSIISFFGFRFHPVYRRYILHKGIDIEAPYGSRVSAAADGIVKFAGWEEGYGNLVKINHGYGLETYYGHNSRILVHCGQTVKKGQIITISGATGVVTGPHLHYEVRINDNPVNPAMFLKN